VCDEYSDVFADPGLPPERHIKHAIKLHDEEAPPPKPRMYRMSQAELAEVRKQLTEYVDNGWIRPSSSSWGAPVIFACKKDGTLGMCIDYR